MNVARLQLVQFNGHVDLGTVICRFESHWQATCSVAKVRWCVAKITSLFSIMRTCQSSTLKMIIMANKQKCLIESFCCYFVKITVITRLPHTEHDSVPILVSFYCTHPPKQNSLKDIPLGGKQGTALKTEIVSSVASPWNFRTVKVEVTHDAACNQQWQKRSKLRSLNFNHTDKPH